MANKYIKNTIYALAGLHGLNYLINVQAEKMYERQGISGHTYNWSKGKVFYRKKGNGKPLLLIHNLGHRSSSYEWDDIIHFLAKNNTVYAVDLPGCGRSEKPKVIYTGYMYIQFINDFIKDVIKEKTNVISSGESYEFIVMANYMNRNNFSKVVLINPPEIEKSNYETDLFRQAYLKIANLPIIGQSLYNIENFSYNALRRAPIENKISQSSLSHTLNAYIASHLDNSNGRFLRASKINKFTKINIQDKIKENICIILSEGKENTEKIKETFKKENPDIHISKIKGTSEFPHMTQPGNTYSKINTMLMVV